MIEIKNVIPKYDEGICFDRKERPSNNRTKNQYLLFPFFNAKIRHIKDIKAKMDA